MITVKICVGSSCHLKGSYEIIEKMNELLVLHGIADKIELKASFCLGYCVNGVTVMSDEEILHDVNPENVEKVFNERVLPLVK